MKERFPILSENKKQDPLADDGDSTAKFPAWLRRKMPRGTDIYQTHQLIDRYKLNTVCSEAKCPNRSYCFSKKTATFLALGKACTRACAFCAIDFSKNPPPPEKDEPKRIAESVTLLGLKHVVITMVTRDDLEDGGAQAFCAIMQEVREANPGVTLEILTSDFGGNTEALDLVLREKPEIFNHNIETVRALTPKIRHKAKYDQTLKVLSYAKEKRAAQFIKSGLMVGLGETSQQVKETIRDLKKAGADIITIGQYLQASKKKIRVKEFITPEQFADYKEYATDIGIKHTYAAPFVRSSYNAQDLFQKISTPKSCSTTP